MAVVSSWRSADDRWLVDLVADEQPTCVRIWDEGVLCTELGSLAELDRWAATVGTAVAELREVPIDDPWCE